VGILLPTWIDASPANNWSAWRPRSTTRMWNLAATQTGGLAKVGSRVAIDSAVQQGEAQFAGRYIVSNSRHYRAPPRRQCRCAKAKAATRTLVSMRRKSSSSSTWIRARSIDVNDTACRFFQNEPAQLLGSGTGENQPAAPGRWHAFIRRVARPISKAPWPAPCRCSSGCTAIRPARISLRRRFVRLPSSNRRMLRASIIDISERKRAEAVAAGERRVFEKIAAMHP